MKELGENIIDIRKEEAKVTRESSGNDHAVTGRWARMGLDEHSLK